MAFWGVEIKPGKPFTHTYDASKGRLHISMATLGLGTAITKSTLQCNVGNKSPVYLCSLYPGTTESLQLNFELEEDGNVIFSVIGPRSIHLCGYYLARGRYTNTLDDESESYGEDIADTEEEESVHSDEDKYDDSFIDDDTDLPVFPPSTIFNEGEASYDRGRKSAKGSRKRLRKKYQLVESDDDGGLEEKKIVNDSKHVQSQEIDDEDSLPISSFCKNKASGGVLDLDQEMDDIVDKEAVDTGKKDGEDPENSTIETELKIDNVVAGSQTLREAEPLDPLAVPCTVLDVGNIKKSKKKKKGKEEETKSSFNDHSTVHDNAAQDEKNMDTAQDLLDQEITDNVDKEVVDAGKKDGEDHENITIETKLKTDNVVADIQTHREAEPSDPLAVPCTVPDVGDIQKLNNNKKDGEDPENRTIERKSKIDNVVAGSLTHREAEPLDPLAVPCTVLDVGNIKKSKKKQKGKEEETKSSCNDHSTVQDNAAQDEKIMNMTQDLLDQKMADNVDKEAVDGGKKDGGDHANSTVETKLKTDNVVANIQTHREAKRSDRMVVLCTVTDVGYFLRSKTKTKGKGKADETKSSCINQSTVQDNVAQDEKNMNTTQDLLDQEMADNVDKEAVDAGKKHGEEHGNITIETKLKTDNVVADIQTLREAKPSDPMAVPCTVPDVVDIKKSKKNKKGKGKKFKSSCNDLSTELNIAAQDEQKVNTSQDLLDQEMADNIDKQAVDPGKNEQHRADDKKVGTADKILPSSQVGQGQDGKRKRKRKEQSKEETLLTTEGNEHNNQDTVNGDVNSHIIVLPSSEKDSQKKTKRKKKDHINKTSHPEGDNTNGEGIIQDEKANKETAENLVHKLSETKEQHQKLTIENSVDNGAQDYPDGNQSEDKKAKKIKKKSKSKSQGSEVVNSDLQVSVEPNNEKIKEDGNNMEDTKSSQVRTLSNGLVIHELETGEKNGKIAALGKKISINYTGKLKENGAEVESNAGQAPFKFRLGKGEVIEGLDIGLEGMRVGEKRRLVIPPSMTSKKNGDSENIPLNSWLVYDLELVKVH